MKKTADKINRYFSRQIIKFSVDKRPTSYPYISGDSFRSLSNHVYDGLIKCNSKEVKKGDVVFVETNFVDEYFKKIHPQIQEKYILLTHNSDRGIDIDLAKNIDEKIIKWFGQNVLINHERIVPIPIGLENLHHYINGIPRLFDHYREIGSEKKNTILFGFNIKTNPVERQTAYDFLINHNLAVKIPSWPTPKEYLKILSGSKFIASPPGNGVDCHRTWEAMYLGVVPIVTRSIVTEYFFSLGLPLLIISDWKEIEKFDEEFLKVTYSTYTEKFNNPYLWVQHWINMIKHVT